MTFEQLCNLHLSEITVSEFIHYLIACLVIFVIVCFIHSIFKFILDLITYFIHKDKYNFGFPFAVRICRYIASLRRQAINAPTEKTFYLYYNRLIGAVYFGLDMGFYSEERAHKFLDVFGKNEVMKKV